MTPSAVELPPHAESARVGHLGTITAQGAPHLVPVCFAIARGVLYTAVDSKPKRSQRLQRLRNLEANPRACLLLDGYDDDWSRLWWVRLDGTARLVVDPDERQRALDALREKYPQYAADPPSGQVLALDLERMTQWAASP